MYECKCAEQDWFLELLHFSEQICVVDETVHTFVFHTRDRKMALLQMATVEEAIQALIDLHSYDMGRGHRLRVSFSKSTIWKGTLACILFLIPCTPYGVLSDIRVHLDQSFLKTILETRRHHCCLFLSISLPDVTPLVAPTTKCALLIQSSIISPSLPIFLYRRYSVGTFLCLW